MEQQNKKQNKVTGIYKFENKLNGKIYIGQSSDIANRYNQHIYDAINRPERATGADVAIAKYGITNFLFELIEQCPVEDLDQQECFWINYYNSYHEGYNRTPGGKSVRGENHPKALVSEAQVYFIRDCYNNHITKSKTYELIKDKISITKRGFTKIWNHETWIGVHADVYTLENQEWHKKATGHSDDQIGLSSLDRAIKQEEIDLWVQEYKNGATINAIASKYNRDNGTVEKYIANPIANIEVKYRGRKLQNVNTGKIFNSISSAAKWAGCGATTLTRHLAKDKIAGKIPNTEEPAEWIELF